MVNYGKDPKFHVAIENVDYYPEIAGVKVSSFPVIAVFSIVPLWFNQFGISVITLFSLITFYYRAGRKEDEGMPLFLNSTLIRISKMIPTKVKIIFLPSLAYIKAHEKQFRR